MLRYATLHYATLLHPTALHSTRLYSIDYFIFYSTQRHARPRCPTEERWSRWISPVM